MKLSSLRFFRALQFNTEFRPARARPNGLRRRGPSRATVCWTLICFIAAQAAFVATKNAHPEMRDPEYSAKITLLMQAARENVPGRPLVLLIGSSRTAFGIRTDSLEANRDFSSHESMVFNFGMCKCTPVLQRLMWNACWRTAFGPIACGGGRPAPKHAASVPM